MKGQGGSHGCILQLSGSTHKTSGLVESGGLACDSSFVQLRLKLLTLVLKLLDLLLQLLDSVRDLWARLRYVRREQKI